MGGGYPAGHSFNFFGDKNPARAAHAINTWTDLNLSPVAYVGDKIGREVRTGGPLMRQFGGGDDPDPVGAAYRWYTYGRPRESWDPLAVTYAIEGKGELFRFGNEAGYNKIEPDGSNHWVDNDSITNQHWLVLKVDNATAAAELDRLYLEGARRGRALASEDGGQGQVDL